MEPGHRMEREGETLPLLERAGDMYRCNREVAADIEQWDDCRKCPEFGDCYRLSTAKLLLASGIVTE